MVWLRLIRWTNLLIILVTQLLAWWCVIVPLQDHYQAALLLTPFHFILLSVSTVLIAAAGYIINDYFDIRIDAINKPDKVILEREIPRRMAIIVHSVMNITALLLAGIVAWGAGHPEWILLQAGCTFLLWKYSTTWKRAFAVGNVIVALMTALTIITLILYEPAMYPYFLKPSVLSVQSETIVRIINPVYVLFTFSFFAFILTWMREIVKDMEDYKGDAEEGCVTMPIQWGLLRSSRFVQLLALPALLVLTYAAIRLFLSFYPSVNLLAVYIVLALILPLTLWTINLPRKANVPHYAAASRAIKMIMVAGIISLLIYKAFYG